MLKKFFAPVLFTSVLVVAGCSSDEASKDLENAEDVEINEGDQKEGSTEGKKEEDTQSDDQTSDSKNSKDYDKESSEGSDNSKDQKEDKDQSNNTSQDSSEEDKQTSSSSDQNTTDGSAGSGGSGGTEEEKEDQNNSSDSQDTAESSKKQYTFKEVKGEAVNVLQGVNAVEVKRKDISGATANTNVVLKVDGKKINLTYNKKRDSFRNYQIKSVDLKQLRQATVVVQG